MALSQSRVGVHYLGRGPEQSLLDAGMRLSKWVNSDPPTNLPSGFTAIWRWVENPDSINDKMGGNPETAALEWISKQWTHILFVPKTVYIEGSNENACENPTQAAWFSRFELERMRLMEARGYKCCIGNFGTGRPSRPVLDAGGTAIWTELFPMLRYARANGHILGMHAYHYDPHDIYHNLRYRSVYAWLPLDAQPKLAITEWGLDGAKGRFRDTSWRSQYPDPDIEYLNIIKAYDAELQHDPYVLGFTIFTDGTNNSDAWHPFDIADQPLISKLAGYLRSSGDTSVANKFNVGQTVYVGEAGSNVLDASGNSIGSQAAFRKGTVLGGPNAVKLSKPTQLFYNIDFESVPDGFVNQDNLLASLPAPSSTYSTRGRCKPHNHYSLWVYRTTGFDQPMWRFDADLLGGGYLEYTERKYVGGLNWYKVGGRGYDNGVMYFEGTGWLPCQDPNDRDNSLEVYALDGKPNPTCHQQVIDVVVTPPPVDPPPPPPPLITIPPNELVKNPFFGLDWTTNTITGNQTPRFWGLAITPNGQSNLWPTHLQQGNTISSIARIVPECVHKLPSQLPANEQLGQPRALLLSGAVSVYKLFGKDSWSAMLSQQIAVIPRKTIRVRAWVLAETPDRPSVPTGLEADHFRVRVGPLERQYFTMRTRRDFLGNERAWNLFEYDHTSLDGLLTISLSFQQMWPGVCDFFVGPVTATYLHTPPEEPPPPPTPKLFSQMTVSEQDNLIEALRAKTGV